MENNQVELSSSQLAEATELGLATHARWSDYKGHYPNKPDVHLRGKIGEVAVEQWAKNQGLAATSWFRDESRERDADLLIGDCRVEVKTWNGTGWKDWGRCVRPEQLSALERKADAILWCYITQSKETTVVTLAGWSKLADVKATPVTTTGPPGNRLTNHQLGQSELRDLSTLPV